MGRDALGGVPEREAAGVASGHLAGLCDTARAMGERAILDDLSQPAAARGVAL